MKLFIIEEHHEALPIWIKHRSLLSSMKLLHVDYHSDMFAPTVHTPLPAWPRMGTADLASSVRDELHINDFLVAAAYLGLFERIDWLRPGQTDTAANPKGHSSIETGPPIRSLSDFCLESFDMMARSKRNEGKEIIVERTNRHHDQQTAPLTSASDVRTFVWRVLEAQTHPGTLDPCRTEEAEASFPHEQVALDIEFDYFVCNSHPCLGKRLEISEREFRNYCDNPYHFLRLHYRTSVYEDEDGYFVEFNPWNEEIPLSADLLSEQIGRSVREFSAWLAMVRIEPTLITLCRAGKSGFCPPTAVELIEELLVRRLDELYSLDLG